MSSFSVLITGCNRGIGLELVKRFLKKDPAPGHLFATARNTTAAGELAELAASNQNLHLIQLDVTSYKDYPEVVNKVSKIVGDKGLNLLINNAGIYPEKNRDLESVTPEDMRNVFEVNCVAPLFMTKAMLPLIARAAQTNAEKPIGIHRAAVIQMSSFIASMVATTRGGAYAYSHFTLGCVGIISLYSILDRQNSIQRQLRQEHFKIASPPQYYLLPTDITLTCCGLSKNGLMFYIFLKKVKNYFQAVMYIS